jgi:hypothetical protein
VIAGYLGVQTCSEKHSETCLPPSSRVVWDLLEGPRRKKIQGSVGRGGETNRKLWQEVVISEYERGKYLLEEVIGSLVGVSGHSFDTLYDLFFTTERVIAVLIQHPADVPRQFTPIWKMMFFGSEWETRQEKREWERTAQARRRTLQNLTPGELVTAHPGNIEIWYSEITSVEITRRLFRSQLRFSVFASPTTGQTTSFSLSKKQIPKARRLLELVLPSKIKGDASNS